MKGRNTEAKFLVASEHTTRACAESLHRGCSIARVTTTRRRPPFLATTPPPPGFLYVPGVVSPAEGSELLAWLSTSRAWKKVTFRGQTARRQVMSFGARYLTQGRQLIPAPPLPPELARYRDRMLGTACERLGRDVVLRGRLREDFALCSVLRYPPGAAIGWHADNLKFAPTVLSLSIGAEARLQLRRKSSGRGKAKPFEVTLAPRSLFVLSGEARVSWEHRILPVHETRYSLTFRAPAGAAEGGAGANDR